MSFWRWSATPGLSSNCTINSMSTSLDQCGGTACSIDGVRDAGVLHLFPGLIAPPHFDTRIGIGLVICRVVVVSDGENLRTFRNCDGPCKLIIGLPVEIVLRHAENDLFF